MLALEMVCQLNIKCITGHACLHYDELCIISLPATDPDGLTVPAAAEGSVGQ